MPLMSDRGFTSGKSLLLLYRLLRQCAYVRYAGCPHPSHAALPQKRQEAFTSYKDYIGMDITSLVTLPVWIMEPFTILQRLAEIMEYTDQLDRAAGTEDQYER